MTCQETPEDVCSLSMTALVKLTLWGYRCLRCGHGWPPRLKQDVDLPRPPKVENEPRICPKCKSPYWNVPRRKAG